MLRPRRRAAGLLRALVLLPLLSLVPAVPFLARGLHAGLAGEDGWERQEPEFRRLARALARSENPYVGQGRAARFERLLRTAALSESERHQVRTRLAMARLKLGEIESAIEILEAEREVARRAGAEREAELLRLLGIARLRQAETENCVLRHEAECCLFPLRGGGVHVEREPAIEARAAFERLLELRSNDLEARWLLNLAAMALGEWPDGVPEEQRIPADAFASEGRAGAVGRFRDVAPELGLDLVDLCGGVAVEDFDGDGLLDVLFSTYDPSGPLTFFRNAGDGSFEDRSAAWRANDQLGGLNLTAADFDGDGDRDVLVLRGAWLADKGRIRNSLLRNDGSHFTDVTRAAGMAEPASPTQTAAWGDFDGDGELDLYVGNESLVSLAPAADHPSQLFSNRGDGTFRDVAAAAGVENDRFAKGVAAGDFDDDGDLDLYVSNVGANRLYRNEDDGTFTDVARRAGVEEPTGRSFACWFFDYGNDGRLDLFVAAYEAKLADVAAQALGLPHGATPPRMYENRGDGTFEDVAEQLGLARPFKPMGAGFGDVDHDGWLDVYLGTGEPQLQSLMPNVLLRNDGGRRFLDVTSAAGLGHLQKGHGVAFADLDHDGDQDLVHQLGGFFPVDRFHNAVFLNPGGGGRFLYLDLVGTDSNRDAIGARVRVVVEGDEGEREIHRAVGSVSSFGGSPRRQEIGLGEARAVRRLEIRWPSGLRESFDDLPLDALLRIVEGEGRLERRPLRRIPMGRAKSRSTGS